MNGASLNYPFCLEDHRRTCKWLGSPPFISYLIRPFGRGTLPYLGDLLTVVINHLLTGMIPQIMVRCWLSTKTLQDGAKRRPATER